MQQDSGYSDQSARGAALTYLIETLLAHVLKLKPSDEAAEYS